MLSQAVISDARIALDGGAVAILPVIALAALFQFRSDHFFEFLDEFVSRRIRLAIGVVVGAALVVVMLVAWFQAVEDLAADHDAGIGLIRAGFGAELIAFALGILDAFGQQGERIRRELTQTRRDAETNPEAPAADDEARRAQ